MKVVVFGGSGFLGSHVADALTKAGHDVTIYDLKRSEYLQSSQKMVVGDIFDEKLLRDTMKGAEAVYNFAGIADIGNHSFSVVETVLDDKGRKIEVLQCRKCGYRTCR